MKFRLDFVTNSSSSSYVCDICGENVSGMDMSISEAEMYQCINGHTFCESHIIKTFTSVELCKAILNNRIEKAEKEKKTDKPNTYVVQNGEDAIKELKRIEELSEEDIEDDGDCEDEICDSRYELPYQFCPLCNFDELDKQMVLKYLITKSNLSEEVLKNELKNRFKSFGELKEFCNENKN